MQITKEKEVGRVIELMPNDFYRVETESGDILGCYLAGKMRVNHIKVMVGDTVEFVRDPYKGKYTNRIIKRK